MRKTIADVADLKDARARQVVAGSGAHASAVALFLAQSRASLAAYAQCPRARRRAAIATLFTDIAGFMPLVELLYPRDLRACSAAISKA